MSYKQLITPNINISATAGMCLQYADNAINAKARTATAQVAHDKAKEKNWVHANTDYPRNVWFIMFWSIDNGDYQGYGHVGLAFVDNNGPMQINDSEVHRGARQPYRSLAELANWFGSVGTRLTFLGWSIGVDGTILIEETQENKKIEELTGDKNMVISFNFKGTGYSAIDGIMVAFTDPKYWGAVINNAKSRGVHVELGAISKAQFDQFVKAYKFGK